MRKIKALLGKVRYKATLLINRARLKKSQKKLQALRNAHQGKRCFIVGNGPSLTAADLEKLRGEICFGTHRVFNIFPETDWRPTYYCAQDHSLIQASTKDVSRLVAKGGKFIAVVPGRRYKKIKGASYVKMKLDPFYPELPKFSEDVSDGIYEGFTVTYMCFQLAVYMGFREIYLLGVDHSYSKVKLPNGEVLENSAVADHFSAKDVLENVPQLYKSTLAYEKAERYTKERGIKIYNATRGGCLDSFERIDFDSLF